MAGSERPEAGRGAVGRAGPPTRPPRRAVAHRWVPAALAAAFPLAPLLSVASYIIARARSKRKRGARCRGRRAEVLEPRARGAPHAAPTRPGERPERPPYASPSRRRSIVAGPLQEAASVTNCVSFFKHRALSLSSPGAATAGLGPRAALAGASRGRRKFPGTLPSPARPSRPARTRALAWATWDPRLRAAPAAR